jgi:hypothetical protein
VPLLPVHPPHRTCHRLLPPLPHPPDRYEQRIKARYLAEQGHQAHCHGPEPLQKASWVACSALLCCLAVKYLARLQAFDVQACSWQGQAPWAT